MIKQAGFELLSRVKPLKTCWVWNTDRVWNLFRMFEPFLVKPLNLWEPCFKPFQNIWTLKAGRVWNTKGRVWNHSRMFEPFLKPSWLGFTLSFCPFLKPNWVSTFEMSVQLAMLETWLKHTLVLTRKQLTKPCLFVTGLGSHWSPALVGKASEAGPCMLPWVQRPWQASLGENKGLLLYFRINRHRYQYKCANPLWVQRPWRASLGEKTKACCCITINKHRRRHLHQ